VSSSINTPGEAGPDDFYEPAPLEPTLLYQGEILAKVPIVNMPKPNPWQLLRTRSGKRVHEALEHGGLGGLVKVVDSNLSTEQWYGDDLGDYVMAVLDKRPALVLNQTCDVQNKDFLQIAPIFPAGNEDYVERLQRGEILSAFWIKKRVPEIQVESYADLELIQAVHKTYLKRINPTQHFRLNSQRIRVLQGAITRYFGRPNSYDVKSDHVPTGGTYLCVGCFYMDALVTSVDLSAGSRFQACQVCQGTQWVLKGR